MVVGCGCQRVVAVVAAHGSVVASGAPRVPRLYYIAMSASRLRAARSAVRVALGDDAWAPPEEMGVITR